MNKTAGIFTVLMLGCAIALAQTHTFPAEDTNNTFTGANSFMGPITTVNNEKILYADQFSAGDIGANVMAAQATCPTVADVQSGVTYPACIISLEGYAGTIQTLTTPIIIASPFVHLRGPGSGQLMIQWLGAGPGIDISTRGTTPIANETVTQAGRFSGFTVIGTTPACAPATAAGCAPGTTNGVGIQYGDIIGGTLDDIVIEGFTGVGGVGLLFNNQKIWTERTTMQRVWVANNTVGWEFENTNSGNPSISVSWGYSRFLDVRMNTYAGQTGMLLTGTVQLYHSVVNLQCNVSAPGAGPVVSLANHAEADDNLVTFFFEGVGSQAVTNLSINGSNVATVTSALNPPVGSQVGFKNLNGGYLINGLEGTVLTTSPSSFTATIPSAAVYSSAADAGFVGFESIRVDATSALSSFGYADYNGGNLVPVFLGAASNTGSAFHIGPIYRQGQQMLDGGYVPSWEGSGSSTLLELITGVNNLWGFGMAENPVVPIFSPFVTMSSTAGNTFSVRTLAGSSAENQAVTVAKIDYQGNISGNSFLGTGAGASIGSGTTSNTDLTGFFNLSSATTVVLTFGSHYTVHPRCTVEPEFQMAGTNPVHWVTYNSGFPWQATFHFSTAQSGFIDYICIANI